MDIAVKRQWTELADTIGQTCLDVLGGAPTTLTEKRFADPKVLAIMLTSRSLAHFKGVFTLIEAGLVVEARILVRCCFENGFWMASLIERGDKFVKEMLQDEMRSRRVRGELVLSKKPQLAEAVERRLREQLRLIKMHWEKAKSLSPKDVSLRSVLNDGYLIYLQLSADATHPTVTSLSRHIGRANKLGEELIEVAPPAKDSEVIQTWDWACNALLGIAVAINQLLGGTPAGQTLGAVADRYQALAKRGKDR
jgi:hypothetical protein